MVKLKNIKKSNGLIQADYYPEDSLEFGFIKLDCSTGEVVESQEIEKYDPIGMYRYHAINCLQELSKQTNIPENYIRMWY